MVLMHEYQHHIYILQCVIWNTGNLHYQQSKTRYIDNSNQ